MRAKELYDYCKKNNNTNRYLIKETAEPLWGQGEVMIKAKQKILAFELDINSIAMYLWAELTANCRVEVSFREALEVVANFFIPSLEALFKERIEQLNKIDDKGFAICRREGEAVMLYGDKEIMESAKLAFSCAGISAFC